MIVLPALRPAAIDDPRRILASPAGEANDLALPLIFERGRADHQHPCDAEMPRQYFRCGNGLDGLAQPHLVADQCPAGPDREQRAFGLIRIERDMQKRPESGVGSSPREKSRQLRGPALRVPSSRDEIERIVISAELVTRLRRQGHQQLDTVEAVIRQHPVTTKVEHPSGGLAQCRRAVCSGPEMDAARAVVAQIQLGKSRSIPARERGLGATLLLQPRQRELDMLAGAELARRIIGT